MQTKGPDMAPPALTPMDSLVSPAAGPCAMEMGYLQGSTQAEPGVVLGWGGCCTHGRGMNVPGLT